MIFDPRSRPDVRENGATLTIQWPSGVIGISQHMTYRMLVQYLRYLASIGDNVTVINVQ